MPWNRPLTLARGFMPGAPRGAVPMQPQMFMPGAPVRATPQQIAIAQRHDAIMQAARTRSSASTLSQQQVRNTAMVSGSAPQPYFRPPAGGIGRISVRPRRRNPSAAGGAMRKVREGLWRMTGLLQTLRDNTDGWYDLTPSERRPYVVIRSRTAGVLHRPGRASKSVTVIERRSKNGRQQVLVHGGAPQGEPVLERRGSLQPQRNPCGCGG
jgi:hypothetical protein